MKLFLILTSISLLNLSFQQSDDVILQNYFKNYRTPRSDKTSQNILRNHRAILTHNQRFKLGLESFNQSLNEFSQLSFEEFSKFKLGALEDDPNEKKEVKSFKERRGRGIEPPTGNFRWPESIVGKVKSQGNCGCCYAFAAINVIKSKLAIRYGIKAFDLSEQDAMECSRGCNGGWEYSVYRDYSQTYGGVAAYNYGAIHSYTAKKLRCNTQSKPKVPNTKVKAYFYLENDEETIKYALINQGPLYARFDVYENFYQYESGIYNKIAGRFLGGHAVMIVGYGEENGVKYWVLKNSWDTWWGEKGYFRMLRGEDLCGIEGRVSYVEL